MGKALQDILEREEILLKPNDMNTILHNKIEEAAFQESSMYNTIQEKNAAYSTGMKIATFASQNQWISVDEALPDDGENVLLILDDGHIIVAYHSGNYWWRCDGFVCGTKTNGQPMYSSSQRVDDKPTHWMMIPPLEGGGK